MCISHDKAFLASISQQVYWLDRGRLKICPRGFGFFDEWSTMILEQEERELLDGWPDARIALRYNGIDLEEYAALPAPGAFRKQCSDDGF